MLIVAKRKIKYPMALEREYAKLLVAHVKRNIKTLQDKIPDIVSMIEQNKVRNDDINTDIDTFIDSLRVLLERADVLYNSVSGMFERVGAWVLKEWNAIMEYLFSVPIRFKSNTDLEGNLATLKEIWVQENLNYIKSIDAEILAKIRHELSDAIISGVNSALLTKQISEKIADIADIEIKRATLIGADQVGKLNSRMAQYRQQNAGLTQYKWSTSRDERVRQWHREREGQIFWWNNPPFDGNPGMAIRCRCVALPVFDTNTIQVEPIKGRYEEV